MAAEAAPKGFLRKPQSPPSRAAECADREPVEGISCRALALRLGTSVTQVAVAFQQSAVRRLYGGLVVSARIRVVADKRHALWQVGLRQRRNHLGDGDMCSAFAWEAIDSCADRWECNGAQAMLSR